MRFLKATLATCVFLGCVLLTGCSDAPALAEVKGQLKMNGKPLANVKVDFQPDPDKGTKGAGSSGVTDEQGNFTLKFSDGSNKPGAIVGHHRVILSDLDLFGTVFVGRGSYRSEDGKGGQREVPKRARFQDIYTDLARTPLKQEVTAGMAPITIEIK